MFLAVGVGLGSLAGCGDPGALDTRPPLPLANVSLTLRCPDAAFADAIEPMVRVWAARTGATVHCKREAMTASDDSDIGVIPVGGLGEWADPGLLAPLPTGRNDIRANDHPFQWSGLLAPYREQLVEWGGQAQAVPLAGDGFVIVYRADRVTEKTTAADFRNLTGRALSVPTTWEDFAVVASFFAVRDKKPSLPPLPADPDRLFDLFCRVAACFDRRALNDLELTKRGGDVDVLAFHHSVKTGKPRLNSPGFEEAAKWLAGLHQNKCLPPPGTPDDPIAALVEDRAVLAVVSLDQLARLPRENGVVSAKTYGLAALPGTWSVYDGGVKITASTPNYIPYFAGGRLGVVRTRSQHPDAAFNLLTELGGPARSSELVSSPGLGAGPFRAAHLDREQLLLWLGYGFDEERSRILQALMRQFVGQTVKNPTFGLRGPDRIALTPVAAEAVRKIGTGVVKPADGLKQAVDAWEALDAKIPAANLLRWRQRAAGLN